ncbi:MAG: hypothetical protein Q9196_005802 [Gyalolechia fulgens]
MQSGARGLYQYALLNLSILHADFGCFPEAITAMQETIATARENHDMPCLNYSLSWLHQFGRKHPEEMTGIQKRGVLGSEKEALLFLKTKAKETNMWTLLSVGCQAWVYTEIFLACDACSSPVEDVLQSQCKSAHMVSLG